MIYEIEQVPDITTTSFLPSFFTSDVFKGLTSSRCLSFLPILCQTSPSSEDNTAVRASLPPSPGHWNPTPPAGYTTAARHRTRSSPCITSERSLCPWMVDLTLLLYHRIHFPSFSEQIINQPLPIDGFLSLSCKKEKILIPLYYLLMP